MKVEKASIREHVCRTLRERILSGEYPPGKRLVELQIARELGTSQGPVREALRELEAARLVETTPRRGTRVRVIGVAEIREAYAARGLLEEAAAQTAAPALKGNVGAIREAVQEILRAAEARQFAKQAASVVAVHRMIVAASGNATLSRLWESLAFETWVRLRLGWGEISISLAERSYERILAALESGDGPLAGRLLREHAATFAPPEDSVAPVTEQ